MTQLAIRVDVAPHEIARERSLGDAIALCVKAGGHEPKDLQVDLKWDKAQWSRWASGQEGILWPKLQQVMDYCGNDVPVLWMLHDRGWELSSLRRRETELEQKLRIAEERAHRAEEKNRVLVEALHGRVAA